jgi:hypothetical protein
MLASYTDTSTRCSITQLWLSACLCMMLSGGTSMRTSRIAQSSCLCRKGAVDVDCCAHLQGGSGSRQLSAHALVRCELLRFAPQLTSTGCGLLSRVDGAGNGCCSKCQLRLHIYSLAIGAASVTCCCAVVCSDLCLRVWLLFQVGGGGDSCQQQLHQHGHRRALAQAAAAV